MLSARSYALAALALLMMTGGVKASFVDRNELYNVCTATEASAKLMENARVRGRSGEASGRIARSGTGRKAARAVPPVTA
jgi:hypothetical protein